MLARAFGRSVQCLAKIRTCNQVDWRLYNHFNEQLDNIIESGVIDDFENKVKMLDEVMNVKSRNANFQKYPVNCRASVNPVVEEFDSLHLCSGDA